MRALKLAWAAKDLLGDREERYPKDARASRHRDRQLPRTYLSYRHSRTSRRTEMLKSSEAKARTVQEHVRIGPRTHIFLASLRMARSLCPFLVRQSRMLNVL
jgi:hypothetical protein